MEITKDSKERITNIITGGSKTSIEGIKECIIIEAIKEVIIIEDKEQVPNIKSIKEQTTKEDSTKISLKGFQGNTI